MNLEERNKPENDKELIYVKHEEKILNVLNKHPEGLTRKELSRDTGMPQDKLYPYLRRLTEDGKCVMRKEVVDNRLMNNYYPLNVGVETVKPGYGEMEAAPRKEEKKGTVRPNLSFSPALELQDTLNEVQQTPTNSKKLSTDNSWGELKNRLIMDGDCGTALKIMVAMEKEATS